MISDERKLNILKNIDMIEYLMDVCPEKFKERKDGNLAYISKSVDLAIYKYDKEGKYHPHGYRFNKDVGYKDIFDILDIVQDLCFPKAVEALEKWGQEHNLIEESAEKNAIDAVIEETANPNMNNNIFDN